MFDRIAGVYDLMNTAMTAGLHHRWRERAADRAELGPGDVALDACCGTGDLSFELARRVGPEGRVIGSDFSERMLDLARQKAAERGLGAVRFELGDALDAQLRRRHASTRSRSASGSATSPTSSAGSGSSPGAEARRPPGILEITTPRRPPLSLFFSLWFDRLVPMLGTLAGDREAYSYLPESVKRFPPPEGLALIMDRAGLERIRYTVLAGGIIAIHSGARRP